jgi:hypothetical protein
MDKGTGAFGIVSGKLWWLIKIILLEELEKCFEGEKRLDKFVEKFRREVVHGLR